jgi:hypothetical protein
VAILCAGMMVLESRFSGGAQANFFNYMLAMIGILELLIYRALKMNRYAK